VRRALGPFRDAAALPGAVRILAVGSLVNRFGAFVLPLLILYLRHHGYDARQAGLALAAYAVGKIAAAPSGAISPTGSARATRPRSRCA
jgi:hypothetical protein